MRRRVLTHLRLPLRLPAYPSFLADDERWLDGAGGAASVRAAALRSADGAGLARGGDWCPGSTAGEREGRMQPSVLPAPDMQDLGVPAARGIAVRLPAPDALSMPHNAASVSEAAPRAATEKPASPVLNPVTSATGAIPSPLANPDEASGSTEQEPMQRQRRRRSSQPWRVEVTEQGLLAGCEPPDSSPRVARLLAAVLDAGHELSEAEMVQLFAARGADFQVAT